MSLLPEPGWLYLRIFPGHGDQSADAPVALEHSADVLLTHCLLPTLRRLQQAGSIQGYFFLRYAEQGYHLRVRCRVRDPDQHSVARTALLAALDTHLLDHPHTFPGASDSAGLIADGRICDSHYQPELDKYGGRAGLDVVESHFRGCTDLAAEALALAAQGLKRDHLSVWLTGQIMYALELNGAEAAGLLAGYARYWMPATGMDMGQASDALEQAYTTRQRAIAGLLPDARGDSVYASTYPQVERHLGTARHLFVNTVARLRTLEDQGRLHSSALAPLEQHAIASQRIGRHRLTYLLIVPNLLHMMNNRIAVNVLTEARLAFFMARNFAGDADVQRSALPVMLQPAPLHSIPPVPPPGAATSRVDHVARSQES